MFFLIYMLFACTAISVKAEGTDITTEEDQQTILSQEIPEDVALSISLPLQMTLEQLQLQDHYLDRQWVITVPGDQTDWFLENPIELKEEEWVDSVETQLNEEGDTEIVIQTTEVCVLIPQQQEQQLLISIKKPKEVYDQVVVIDAGHGGSDSGCVGNGLKEKNLTLSLLKEVKKQFDASDFGNQIKVYYTRLQDQEEAITAGSDSVKTTGQSLVARYDFTNETEADLFLSIHINAVVSKKPKGTEVYYSSKNNTENEMGLTSKQFAKICLPKLVKAVGSTNRGVKDGPNLAVLKNADMPAILTEIAFVSNASDAKILASKSKQAKIGKALYEAVMEGLGRLN